MKEKTYESEFYTGERSLFGRALAFYRRKQFERLIDGLHDGNTHHRTKDANMEVRRNNHGGALITVWNHQKGGNGTKTEIQATYDDDYYTESPLLGVSVTQQRFQGDVPTWEIEYSSYRDPAKNSMSAGEVVKELRLAAAIQESTKEVS